MIAKHCTRRGGFTLLEIVLAVSIGMVLLYGLYRVMELQVAQTEVGRELVEQGTVARGIFTRMSADILNTIRPIDPREAADSSTSSSGATTDSSAAGATGATSGSGTTNSTASTTTDTSAISGGSTTTTTMTTAAPFNMGVEGGSDWLILTVGRVPRELPVYEPNPERAQTVSDLRRVMYWLASGNKGLAWYSSARVNSPELADGPETVPEEEIKYLAPEVVELKFEYFDGASGWMETWSSSELSDDGVTPLGPPAAIRMTLTLRRGQADADGQAVTDSFSHVVHLPTANNLIPQTTSP